MFETNVRDHVQAQGLASGRTCCSSSSLLFLLLSVLSSTDPRYRGECLTWKPNGRQALRKYARGYIHLIVPARWVKRADGEREWRVGTFGNMGMRYDQATCPPECVTRGGEASNWKSRRRRKSWYTLKHNETQRGFMGGHAGITRNSSTLRVIDDGYSYVQWDGNYARHSARARPLAGIRHLRYAPRSRQSGYGVSGCWDTLGYAGIRWDIPEGSARR
jgi:hypothetical protein